MKKALRVLPQSQASIEDGSSGACVGADVIVVADTATGDSALRWALLLLRQLVALGAEVRVGVHSSSSELAHREALRKRFVEEGALVTGIGPELASLAATLPARREGQVSLLVGGLALRHVEGGVHIVIRAQDAGRPGSREVEALERKAKLILGSAREAFAEHYARRVLGIE